MGWPRLVVIVAAAVLPAWADVAPPALDTPAQEAVRKLPKDFVNARPPRFSAADKARADGVTRLDEVLVTGQRDPEDFNREIAAMLQFRQRLENDRPATPKDRVQGALCLIGLCGIYGPDGAPPEPSRDAKRDAALRQSTTQLNGQFRGTLQ